VICIVGKSCSGKDSVTKELINYFGYSKLITTTTRPIRPNEQDGVDYHFISIENFLNKLSQDYFLEFRFYETKLGIWFYGSSFSSYQTANNNTIAILTPSGLKKLKEHNIPHTSFYINVSDEIIKQRQIERNDKPEEAERRFNADKLDFVGINNMVDYVIDNENRDISEVAKEIDKLYKGSLKKGE